MFKKIVSLVLTNVLLFFNFCANIPAEIVVYNKNSSNLNNQVLLKECSQLSNYGNILNRYLSTNNSKLIINIRNTNTIEAQENIIGILEYLEKEYLVDNIFLEGMYDDLDIDWFLKNLQNRNSNTQNIKLNKMLQTGLFSGTELFVLKNDKTKLLKIVDDKYLFSQCLTIQNSVLEADNDIKLVLAEINELISNFLNNKKLYIEGSRVEQELLFLKNFTTYINKYLTFKLTYDEYKYYHKYIGVYKDLYNKYIDNKLLSLLNSYMINVDKFYELSFKRHEIFINNILKLEHEFSKNVSVIISNDLFSELNDKYLELENISYIDITPNKYKDYCCSVITPELSIISKEAKKNLFKALKNKNNIISNINDKKINKLIAVAKVLESDDVNIASFLKLIKSKIDVNLVKEVRAYLINYMNLNKLREYIIVNTNINFFIVETLRKYYCINLFKNFMTNLQKLIKYLSIPNYYAHYNKKGLCPIEDIENRVNNNIKIKNEVTLEQLQNRDFNGRTFKYIIGFTTFLGVERCVKDNMIKEFQVEDYLNRLIKKYGRENILVVSKAIDLGGIFDVYHFSSRLGLSTLGIISLTTLNNYKKYIMGCDYYRIIDDEGKSCEDLGFESDEFVDLIDELFVFGGGEVSANEMILAKKQNKKIVMLPDVKRITNNFGQAQMSYDSIFVNGKIKVQEKINELESKIELKKSQKKELEEAKKSLNYFNDYKNLVDINKLFFITNKFIKNNSFYYHAFIKYLWNKTIFSFVYNLNNIKLYNKWLDTKNCFIKSIIVNMLYFGITYFLPQEIVYANNEELNVLGKNIFFLEGNFFITIFNFNLALSTFFAFSAMLRLNLDMSYSLLNNFMTNEKEIKKKVILIDENNIKYEVDSLDKNKIIITKDYKQLTKIKKYIHNNSIYSIRLSIGKDNTIRGGFLLDEYNGIRVKLDRQYNNLVFYSKKGLNASVKELKRYFKNLYLNGYIFETIDIKNIIFVDSYEIN